ncbi:MAG: hypothetical protein JWM38_1823, partial [Sphingomonas bacterium]|nr:hypothetical protein [Sphingomonas bacterium]
MPRRGVMAADPGDPDKVEAAAKAGGRAHEPIGIGKEPRGAQSPHYCSAVARDRETRPSGSAKSVKRRIVALRPPASG